MANFGSSDSGASLGDILGAALQRQQDGEEVAGMRICPLHSSLPVEFYQRVFDEPPTGTRKLSLLLQVATARVKLLRS